MNNEDKSQGRLIFFLFLSILPNGFLNLEREFHEEERLARYLPFLYAPLKFQDLTFVSVAKNNSFLFTANAITSIVLAYKRPR